MLAKLQLPNEINAKFELQDFFTLGTSEEKFDLVYDYTYLSSSIR